jgi:hypothetical protein
MWWTAKRRKDNSTIHATKALEEELHVTALLIEEAQNAFKATKAGEESKKREWWSTMEERGNTELYDMW